MRKPKLTKVDRGAPIQFEPNKWYRVNSPEVTECCSCGLIHESEYALYNGMLIVRARVNKRATRAARKRDGIVLSKVKK